MYLVHDKFLIYLTSRRRNFIKKTQRKVGYAVCIEFFLLELTTKTIMNNLLNVLHFRIPDFMIQ